MKKVQDPSMFSRLIACSPSEPWQPGIFLCQCWQQIQGTASPAAVGSLLGTKPCLEYEAAFLFRCTETHFICGFLGKCTLCQAGLMQPAPSMAYENCCCSPQHCPQEPRCFSSISALNSHQPFLTSSCSHPVSATEGAGFATPETQTAFRTCAQISPDAPDFLNNFFHKNCVMAGCR